MNILPAFEGALAILEQQFQTAKDIVDFAF